MLIASASFRLLFLKLRNSFGLHLPLIQKHGGNLWHKQLQFPTLTALSVTLKFPQRNPEKYSALPSVAWVEVSAVMGAGWVRSAASVQLPYLRLQNLIIISWKLYKSVPLAVAEWVRRAFCLNPSAYRGRY